ncbi:MAG: glycogen synthase GlgA [Oscillospiraceae bacterium]|nr:glycogen synthase GlgA [Oscillospiraceae bacterium]
MISVLMAAAEVAPFVKTGGLGDVLGALPAELVKKGVDVRVIMPKYKSIPSQYTDEMNFLGYIYVYLGWRKQYCGIYELSHKGYKVYFLDNEYYFGGDRIYYSENIDVERFAFFSMAVLSVLPHIDFMPDIIHCHDWHSALIPVSCNAHFKRMQFYSGIKFVMTIHNIKFQGICSRAFLYDLMGLNDGYNAAPHLYYYDIANCLKGGLSISDAITTVSESYAREILYPFFAEGLEGVLNIKAHCIRGILNGIDYSEYDPKTDPHIMTNYDSTNFRNKKRINKDGLQQHLGIERSASRPLIAIISRLTTQKGMDLITHVFDELINTTDVQFVILGTGEWSYEQFFIEREMNYSGRVSSNIFFDEELARKIYAGSDFFLMPSLFEPCGLSQMIAMRYGTVPIVREIGGLKDTVIPFDKSPKCGTGFSFEAYNAHEMLFTIKRAIEVYRDPSVHDGIVERAMKTDFSWEVSVLKYMDLYKSLAQT